MDEIVDKIAGLGIPGLVLLVMMATTGLVGAAAITTALAALGGPFGMLGGITVLLLLGQISKSLAAYGIEAIFERVVVKLKEQGYTKQQAIDEIKSYWFISRDLEKKLLELIEKLWR